MLTEFSKKYNFILIGGWSIYLYSKLQKSRDIDIIVSYEDFALISNEFTLSKNAVLKKYEIKFTDFDVDIYLPYFSNLTIPPSDILESYTTVVENIKVPVIEALITLKLGAYKDRRESIKGDKDRLDIVGLLLTSDIDFVALDKMFQKYNLKGFFSLMEEIFQKFDQRLFPYLNLNENTFSKLRKRIMTLIRPFEY